ncbi:hypothetical protein TNCV_2794711 [Trichonephila clavipes]|nr:hypothetical protein TNCV_2794711 [Trichonephila clavipes]
MLYALKLEAATQASLKDRHLIRRARMTADEPCESRLLKEMEILKEEIQTAGFHTLQVAAIRDISRSCLDPNDFTVLNCIVKVHASLSPPSLPLCLCSRFPLLATYTYFNPKDFSPHPIDSVKGHASLSPLAQQKAKKKIKRKRNIDSQN